MNTRFKVTLYINYFVYAILLNSVGIVILKSITLYGVSKVEASTLELLKDLPIAIASFAAASLIPRFGHKNSMILALSIVIVGMLQMYFINQFFSAQILFITVGASFALIKVNVYASIGLLTNSERAHNSMMSSIEGTFMFGIALAYFMFPAFNSNVDVNAWLNVYLALITICLLSILFLIRTPNLITAADFNKKPPAISSMITLMTQLLVIVFVISAFLFVMVEQSIMTWLPTFNNQILKLDENTSVQMASILAIALGAGRLTAGWISKTLDWSIVLSGAILGGMLLVYFVLPSALNTELDPSAIRVFGIPLAAFTFPLVGFFIAPIYPLLNSAVLSAVPVSLHSAMAGLIIVSSALGGTMGSRITGYFFDLLGGSAFYFSLVPMTLLLLAVQLLRKLTRQQIL